MKIAIATPQYLGQSTAGGIAPPTTNLARSLAQRGHSVSVLVLGPEGGLSESQIRKEASYGVSCFNMSDSPMALINPQYATDSYRVHQWVLNIRPDVFICNDFRGYGAIHSMHTKYDSDVIPIVTWIHGNLSYVRAGNRQSFHDRNEIIVADFERIQLENSDFIVSPTDFLASWYREQGFNVPPHEKIPYHRNLDHKNESNPKKHNGSGIGFVGRLSKRKGIPEFVDAIIALNLTDRDIFFYGPEGDDGVNQDFVLQKFEHAGISRSQIHFIGNLSGKKLWSSIKQNVSVVVVPSYLDNSPNVVSECALNAVPLVAFDTGGIPEMLTPESSVNVLVKPTSTELAKRLKLGLSGKQPFEIPCMNEEHFDLVSDQWENLLERLVTQKRSQDHFLQTSDTSCIIVTHNRPHFVQQALNSVLSQELKPYEIIIVDDNSTSVESKLWLDYVEELDCSVKIRVIRQKENTGPSIARNNAARLARGKYLAFLDDDNIWYHNHLQSCQRILDRDKAVSAVAPAKHLFFANERDSILANDLKHFPRELYFGSFSPAMSFLGNFFGKHGTNTLGDTNFVIKRDKFLEYGGFDGARGGFEDWNFLMKIILGGEIVAPLNTYPTFAYQISSSGSLNQRDNYFWDRNLDSTFATKLGHEWYFAYSYARYPSDNYIVPLEKYVAYGKQLLRSRKFVTLGRHTYRFMKKLLHAN